MCGIFGASLNPKVMDRGMTKAAIAKFKMLGIYNVERGKHSCGVYVGNTVIKGVDNHKLFYDFIAAQEFPDPMETGNYTMIGHTRAATHGSHVKENAHPFRVNDFVLAHNGVIRNIWNLCNKYKINHSHIHVDSLALAHIIDQEGFGVLNEYEGVAALLMSRVNEPNSLYVYRGVSIRVQDGTEEEERPMYYLQCEEGMYFSSLEKSLLAISDSSTDRIKQLEGNVVHKITNGVITKSKIRINRDTINLGVNLNTHGGSPMHNYPKTTGIGGTQSPKQIGTPMSMVTPPPTSTMGTNSHVGSSYPPNPLFASKTIPVIWHETIPSRVDKYKDKKGIIFHLGRYWVVENEEIVMAHGSYYINKKGVISPHKAKAAHNWFFYEGVMMKSHAAFKAALGDADLKNLFWNYAVHISKYCDYPISNSQSNIASACKDVSDYIKYRWFQNGNMCTNTGFTPKFSDRNYIIKDGLLHSIAAQKNYGPAEICIDIESLRIARATIADQELVSPSIKMTDLLTRAGIKQDELPFPKEGVPAEKEPEWDATNFYRHWESIEQARKEFTTMELNSIRYYVTDIMVQEMNIYPDTIFDDQVDVQLNMLLSICVENNCTIMDQWDDKNYKDITDYLIIARDNPKGEFFQTVEDVEDVEESVCEFIPKPPESNVVDIEARVAQIEQDALKASNEQRERHLSVVVNNMDRVRNLQIERMGVNFMTNAQDSMDQGEFVIDQITAREQARVPNEEDPEGPFYVDEADIVDDPNIERDYAFMDVVDYMNSCRDCADELQSFSEDDLAQKAANIIYRAVDPILRDLHELAIEHSEGDLEHHVKGVMGKRVNV